MAINLGKLDHVDPRNIWDKEARDFTPWLADHLDLLGEALGIDLELIKIEKSVGDFSCDIQAHDTGRDRPVIIENQLEPTDHRHLGQLVTYAAGLDAAVVIWISPEVREEHREALDWLNRHTDERIEFFGVALETIRIDDSKPAAQFRPVAFPNTWSKTVSSSARSGELSDKRISYQQFFQSVLDELREKHRFTNARAAQPQNWYTFPSGTRGIVYGAAFASRERLRAELYIDVGDAARNKAIFDALLASKDRIEKDFDALLEWERLDNRRASRIAFVRPDTSIEDAADHGDEIRAWLIQGLLKMKAVFGPLLKAATQVSSDPER